jgi:ribosomal subunit interface protein
MQVIMKKRDVSVDPELLDYAEQKVRDKCATYIHRHSDAVVCEIEFQDLYGSKGGVDKRVDVTMDLPHKARALHIEESDLTFKESIDKLVDRLDKPLARYKELHH